MIRTYLRRNLGARILLLAVLIVDAFAIAGLMGWIRPVVGAAVGLGAQVIGTIAFFAAYYVDTWRTERRDAALGARESRLESEVAPGPAPRQPDPPAPA